MQEDIESILIHESTILARLDEMAAEITRDYAGKDLTVIAILNGSFIFVADLLRRIPLPLQVDCLSVASYHGTKSTGTIHFRQTNLPDVKGRHVLILDDILDSGLTIHAISTRFLDGLGALSVKTCVLLEKQVEKVKEIRADYVGFSIENKFVIGYGLDYLEHYRHVSSIGVLKPSAIERVAAESKNKFES